MNRVSTVWKRFTTGAFANPFQNQRFYFLPVYFCLIASCSYTPKILRNQPKWPMAAVTNILLVTLVASVGSSALQGL